MSTHKRPRPLTYTLMHVMLAHPVQPMPEPRRRHQLTRMWQGLAAIEQGDAPTTDDWRVLSDAVNLLETLVLQGTANDDSGLIMDGITALALAGRRHVAGSQIRLDAPGIAATRAALEDYAALLEVLPERVIVQCHRDTEIRIRAILAGKRKAHDVEIVEI
jgi:hypothetical protein